MSSTSIRRAALSAVTLFGGHFLNRRIDRVASIGTLLALAAMMSVGLPVALINLQGYDADPGIWILKVPAILVGAIACVSAWLTFVDARQPLGPSTPTLRLTALPLSLFGVVVLAVSIMLAGISEPEPGARRAFATEPVGHIEFGNSPARPYGLHSDPPPPPEPPRGTERLRGRITLDGAGIKGARITLSLNGEYQVALQPDSAGSFEARLPAGEWRINDVAVNDWDDRPVGRELLLFSDHEPTRRGGQYSRFNYLLADGLPVSLPGAPNAHHIELEFRDAIRITWPPRATNPPDADFATAAITWLPVDGASEYQVQIALLEYPEEIWADSPVLTRRVSNLELPLASLPQRTPTTLNDKYAVHIFAFDAEGRLLTESNTKSERHVFTLSGASRLGKEKQYVGFDGPPLVISAEYELNETRIEVARRLLDQKRFEEALRMIEQVTEDAPCGAALALRGKLAALQGDCVTANKLFDEAQAKGVCGCGCVPDDDRRLCEKSEK